jgi:hypothetical protein
LNRNSAGWWINCQTLQNIGSEDDVGGCDYFTHYAIGDYTVDVVIVVAASYYPLSSSANTQC